MRIDIISLFPQVFLPYIQTSMMRKAQERGIAHIFLHNLRDFAMDKHRTTDDYPYGGGAGMLLKPEPIYNALEDVKRQCGEEGCVKHRIILTSPQGMRFNQSLAEELAKESHLVIICGHYEGVDDRVLDWVDDEISLGDFILTGGEIPAMAIVDAVVRLQPDVLSEEEALREESVSSGILEYPQFTRPAVFEGEEVPSILRSGNHQEVARWRRRRALERTLFRRPDLLISANLSMEDLQILKDIMRDLQIILEKQTEKLKEREMPR
ncbi:tRNA (guanosine(37)-N1)-methyltransferase TrmD [bacterium]|nr:tRNA (guanosine(37)-N1)-methyltransferase TrmD [bacterium]